MDREAVLERAPVVRTRTGEIWLGEDGIVRSNVVIPQAEIGSRDAHDSLAAIQEVSGGLKRPVITDIRAIKSADRGSRAVSAGPDATRMIIALAIFADSPASRVIGNIFLTVNKPIFPTRIFTDEGEALAWLEDYLQ